MNTPETLAGIKTRLETLRTSPATRLTGLTALALTALPATALASNHQLGSVYCGTPITGLIEVIFGALIGLALPVAMIYTTLSGFRYMRSGGNPDAEREAKQRLYYSMTGLGIVVLVVIFPELADKAFEQVGMGFSDCVKPF